MPKRVRVTSQRQREQHERPDGDQEQVVFGDRAARRLDRAVEARSARAEQSSAPQIASVASRTISTTPNVAVSCRSSGAA